MVCSAGERLHDAVRDLDVLGVKETQASADLATRDGVRRLWEAVEQLGYSGIGVGGLLWETNLEQELNLVELNCTGTVQLAKYV